MRSICATGRSFEPFLLAAFCLSCGAAIHVARKIAEEMDEGVIVTILADAGWKYLSADFWEASDEDLEESMERTIWW